jgi:hypothetical protein
VRVTAKTKDGVLIEATEGEVKEILASVTGSKPKEIEIGQKIPAIDYASTITKIKTLEDDYHFKQIISALEAFNEKAEALEDAVHGAARLDGE